VSKEINDDLMEMSRSTRVQRAVVCRDAIVKHVKTYKKLMEKSK
jgi:hypothetical protein